jgi:hypothetical protein
MKICSFDIGSGNLAFTIMEIDCNKNKIIDLKKCKILKFNLIDLFDPNNSINFNGCISIIKTGKRKGQMCNNITISNLQYCGRHTKQKIITKSSTNSKTKFYSNKKKICQNLIKILNNISDLTDVNHILIEQQVPKNKMMIEISHYLYMYLLNRLYYENKQNVKLEYLTAKKRMNTLCNLLNNNNNNIIFKSNNTKYDRKKMLKN